MEAVENTEPQTADEPVEGEEQQGADFGPLQEHLDSRLEQFGSQVAEQLSPLQQALEQLQQPEPEPERNLFDDPDFDPYSPQAQQQMQAQMDQRVEQRVQQMLDERLNPLMEERLEERFDALEQKYPALAPDGDPKVQQAVVADAERLAGRLGIPGAVQHPEFLEMAYLAQVGRQRAEQETPAGAQTDGVTLEQGGATPAEPQEDDVFQRLHAQGQSAKLDWPG